MPDRGRPRAPGPMVQPNVRAILEALRDVTFPISKRDLMQEVTDEDTVVIRDRNVELRTLIRDLNDDYFETEDELREALEGVVGHDANPEAIVKPFPPSGFPETMPRGAPGSFDQPAVPDDNP